MWNGVSIWPWFVFSQSPVMLHISLYVYWPYVLPFCEISVHVHISIGSIGPIILIKMFVVRGTWMTHLVEHLTLDFSSGHGRGVLGLSPTEWGSMTKRESSGRFPPSLLLSYCPSPHSLSLIWIYILVLISVSCVYYKYLLPVHNLFFKPCPGCLLKNKNSLF